MDLNEKGELQTIVDDKLDDLSKILTSITIKAILEPSLLSLHTIILYKNSLCGMYMVSA